MNKTRKQKGRKNSVRHFFHASSVVDSNTFFTLCGQRRQWVVSAFTHQWQFVTCPMCLKKKCL